MSTIAAFLLNVHVQIDEVDEEGWSPLIHACVLGKTQAALTLLDNGAQIDLKVNQIDFLNQLITIPLRQDCEGCSALHHAARERRTDCVRLLVERGASLEVKYFLLVHHENYNAIIYFQVRDSVPGLPSSGPAMLAPLR